MKIQRSIKIQNTLGYSFLVLQLISYLYLFTQPKPDLSDTAYAAGYFTGMHIFLIIAIIFLLNVRSLKKKLTKQEQERQVDSIGAVE